MMIIVRLFAAASILSVWTACVAQDPFGPVPVAAQAANAADPFGVPANGSDDPFGDPTDGSDDPFGRPAGGSADPFGPHAGVFDNLFGGTAPATDRRAGLTVEEAILKELDQPTSVFFVEEPLESAMRNQSEMHDIPIVIDQQALEESGLTSDTPISLQLKNVKLRSALKIALHDLELTYVIRNEVLIITTVEAAEKMPTLRSYTLPEPLAEKSDQVINALTTTVAPDAWRAQGGPSTAAMIKHVLVVSAPEAVHESVVEFLAKVQAAFERHQAAAR